MKDPRSILLALLSVSLLTTWIYHLYDKNQYTKRTREVFIKDSAAVAEAVSDSLKKIFAKTLNQLSQEKQDIDLSNTTLKKELGSQLTAINTLKDEISNILKRKNITQQDLDEAKIKIRELQTRIGGLQSENSDLSQEKAILNGLVDQLNTEMTALQLNMSKVTNENKQLAQTVEQAATFIASNISIQAVQSKSGNREVPTGVSRRAEKFVVSFAVQNNVNSYPNAEVVIVITEPSGKIMSGDIWDSGSFETRQEGRKRFTRKMRFEYIRMESKKVIFSIEPDEFEKGTYKFSLYHNGYKIGESACKLS